MNEEEMDKQIAEIIREALGNMDHSSCNHEDSQCYKDSPDYEPRHIHCGTEKCKGLHKTD